MAELSDETLMMFADRLLDAEQHASVAAIIAGRPDLAAKVARFEQSRRTMRVFDGVIEEPVPQALVDQVRRVPRAVSGENVTRLDTVRHRSTPPAARAAPGRWQSWTGLSAAASICLVAGAAGGWIAHSKISAADVAAQSAMLLQAALEDVPSGGVGLAATAGRTLRLRPVATFLAKDKRHCRDYALERGDGTTVDGVACRAAAGGWQVIAEAVRSAAGAGMGTAGSIGNAEGEPLSRDEEAKLIASKWHR